MAAGLLIAGAVATAQALTVSAPVAGVQSRSAPLMVRWQANHPGLGIDIELVQVSPRRVDIAVLASDLPNTGGATVMLPGYLSCDSAYSYAILVASRPRGEGAAYVTRDNALSPPFRLSCEDSRASRVTVNLRVVNNTVFATPPGAFQVLVDCGPVGSRAVVRMTPPGDLQQSVPAPLGARCAVEAVTPPQTFPPCRWTVTYPSGRQAMPGGSLNLVNELRCDGARWSRPFPGKAEPVKPGSPVR